jgi:predicted kinase
MDLTRPLLTLVSNATSTPELTCIMGTRIIYIGGASASGKTATAVKLSAMTGLPVVELDEYYDLLVDSACGAEVAAAVTPAIARRVVEDLLDAGGNCIVEGGWIDPSVAAELREGYGNAFQPVFCGYPVSQVGDRLAAIVASGEHWLADKSRAEARAFLAGQVKASKWYERECARCGIPFVDFSDPEAGQRRVLESFRGTQDRCPGLRTDE